MEETAPLLQDPDLTMRSLASEEFNALSDALSKTVKTIFPALLIPPSTTCHLSALMELKSGVGGSESSLFLSDLLRMYQRLAHSNNWKSSIVAENNLESGGIKDAIVEIKGETAYDTLRWESGVHRVQRVPATEASGRTHTSTVAVVVSTYPFGNFIRILDIWSGITSYGRNRYSQGRTIFYGRH